MLHNINKAMHKENDTPKKDRGGDVKILSTRLILKIEIYNNLYEHTHTHTPVSYTHLDVYKRQAFEYNP